MNFTQLQEFLKRHLLEDIVPFWVKHGVDWEYGGIYNFIADDGTVVKTDKPVTGNARALWTLSALYNRVQRDERWLEAADLTFAFLKNFGRDENGLWNYVVDRKGNTILGEQSIITDAFAIYGLVEYYRLSGNDEALSIAEQTYNISMKRLAGPGTYKTAPYPVPDGMKAHREAMQFSLMLFELWQEIKKDEILEHALFFSNEVLDHFYRQDMEVLLEYIGLDNRFHDTPEGRVMVPGHGIESLWFQIYIRSHPEIDHKKRATQAAHAVRPCLEKGWDTEYGGIYLGIDVKGEPPAWPFAETKRWWPHTEALCGTLLAYEQLEAPWALDWFRKIHEWTFNHFPDREHGEWVENLARDGRPLYEVLQSTTGNDQKDQNGATSEWINYDLMLKDFFHLPRALIIAMETINRLKINKKNIDTSF